MSVLNNLSDLQFPKGAYLSHFSFELPLACVITRVEGHNINIVCSRTVSNILIGDPVICKFVDGEDEFIITGDVINIHDNNSFTVLVTGIDKYKNNRKHKRYAISLNAVVAGIESMDYICSTVKSISYTGISINSSHSYEIGSMIIVSIITSTSNVIHFIANVLRKNQILDYYEYGIEISSIVSPNKEKLEAYIDSLEREEKDFIELAQGK